MVKKYTYISILTAGRRACDGWLRLFLTEKGRQTTKAALDIELRIIEISMSTSTPEECDLVGEVMTRMIDNMAVSDE